MNFRSRPKSDHSSEEVSTDRSMTPSSILRAERPNLMGCFETFLGTLHPRSSWPLSPPQVRIRISLLPFLMPTIRQAKTIIGGTRSCHCPFPESPLKNGNWRKASILTDAALLEQRQAPLSNVLTDFLGCSLSFYFDPPRSNRRIATFLFISKHLYCNE